MAGTLDTRWRRVDIGLSWPRVHCREKDIAVRIKARHYAPDSLKNRFWQGVEIGAAFGLLSLVAVLCFGGGPASLEDDLATGVLIAPFWVGMCAAAGVKLFCILQWIKSTTVITITPGMMVTRGPGVRGRYRLHEDCAFGVIPHPDGRWEAEVERERQENLQYQGKKDTSEYPGGLRRVYQHSFQVYMHEPRGSVNVLANIYMSERDAGTLANVISKMAGGVIEAQRLLAARQRSGSIDGSYKPLA